MLPLSHSSLALDDIPSAQNTNAVYADAEVKGAPHSEAARLWLSFILQSTCPTRVWNGIFAAGDRRPEKRPEDDISEQRPEFGDYRARKTAAKAAFLPLSISWWTRFS